MDIEYYKKYEPIDSKWYLKKELGSGAYGSVFEVERKDEYGSMNAAMKIISIPASESELESFRKENYTLTDSEVADYYHSFVDEFYKECQMMSQLKGYTNIVSYEDHDIKPKKGTIGWDIFIRMELLTPLNEHFSKKKYTKNEVIKLGIDICRALEVCQEKSIIHRDIKAGNIFVSQTGDFKLGDFGVARSFEGVADFLSKKGTYIYMAPEVCKGEKYGFNADIYSLGIVLYKIMNENMEPFRTERTYTNGEEALKKRLSGEKFPMPKNADAAFSKIIFKACAYDPKDRYQNATEMREDLEELLGSNLYNSTMKPHAEISLKNKEPSLGLKPPKMDTLLKKPVKVPERPMTVLADKKVPVPEIKELKKEATPASMGSVTPKNSFKISPSNPAGVSAKAPAKAVEGEMSLRKKNFVIGPKPEKVNPAPVASAPVIRPMPAPSRAAAPAVSAGPHPRSAPVAAPIPPRPPVAGAYGSHPTPGSRRPPDVSRSPVTPGDVRSTFVPPSRGKTSSKGSDKLFWGIVGGVLLVCAVIVGIVFVFN